MEESEEEVRSDVFLGIWMEEVDSMGSREWKWKRC